MLRSFLLGWYSAIPVILSLAGAATNIIFVATKVLSRQTRVATNVLFPKKKNNFFSPANDIILRVSKKENCGLGKKENLPDIFHKTRHTMLAVKCFQSRSLFCHRSVNTSLVLNPLVCCTLGVWTRMDLLVSKPLNLFYSRIVNTYGVPCFQTR